MSDAYALADLDAEEAIIGSLLISKRTIEDLNRMLDRTDFHSPAHANIFSAVLDLYASGEPVDGTTVAAKLRDDGLLDSVGGPAAIVSLAARAGRILHADAYAARVIEMRCRRDLFRIATEARDALIAGQDSGDVAERSVEAIGRLDSGDVSAPVGDLIPFRQWVASSEDHSEWVIPDLMRSDWRLLLTAPAGVGKTTLTRQIGFAAANGIHPFTFAPIRPIPVLIVDLENPASAVRQTGMKMISQVDQPRLDDQFGGPLPADPLVWSQIGGINIRERRDRILLERHIAEAHPKLVVLGPVYKSFHNDSRRASDEITIEVCNIFDDLRTRYGFALILEHHSPRGSQELVPFGSSVWERWPEFGRTLRPDETDRKRLVFSKFRPDRVVVHWPRAFKWDKGWPFVAEWSPRQVSEF